VAVCHVPERGPRTHYETERFGVGSSEGNDVKSWPYGQVPPVHTGPFSVVL